MPPVPPSNASSESPSGAASVAQNRIPDLIAIGLSGLCLVHCLLLPVIVVALPMLGVFAEDERIHQILISLAVPVSLWAVLRSGHWRNLAIILPMMTGLSLLGLAAFAEPLHDYEVPISVAGALLLALAHWKNARHRHVP
ncbi:MAG: MerC domain-containing protein [Asticcacaulis sp.]